MDPMTPYVHSRTRAIFFYSIIHLEPAKEKIESEIF